MRKKHFLKNTILLTIITLGAIAVYAIVFSTHKSSKRQQQHNEHSSKKKEEQVIDIIGSSLKNLDSAISPNNTLYSILKIAGYTLIGALALYTAIHYKPLAYAWFHRRLKEHYEASNANHYYHTFQYNKYAKTFENSKPLYQKILSMCLDMYFSISSAPGNTTSSQNSVSE